MSVFDNIIVTVNTVEKLLTPKQLSLLKKISNNNKVTFQTKAFSNESHIYIIKRNKLYLLDRDKETPIEYNGYIRISSYINYNNNSYWVSFNIKFSQGKKVAIDLHKFETVKRDNNTEVLKKTQKIKCKSSSLLGLFKKILSIFK